MAILGIVATLQAPAAPGPGVFVFEAFDAPPGIGGLPAGWTPEVFSGRAASRYEIVFEDGDGILRGRADRSGSLLWRPATVDPATHPILRFRARPEILPAGADGLSKGTDDFAFRVSLLFRGDPDALGWLARRLHRSAERERGHPMPTAMLQYVWATAATGPAWFWNPYVDRTAVFPVGRGSGCTGRWIGVRCDWPRDYRQAFGEDPPPMIGVTIMVDADDTGTRAGASIDAIEFAPRGADP
ncbi:MAG: DUF3047 domain-containing protein [Planctomycetes bacterium]|nr:DUF3047 domain-containing protein [Planctomycetota bacterium]